jgi:hypothetical protein
MLPFLRLRGSPQYNVTLLNSMNMIIMKRALEKIKKMMKMRKKYNLIMIQRNSLRSINLTEEI